MITALTEHVVRSFSANERWVRLPPLRRVFLERKVCGWRHARLENGMPFGAGFDSYAFREHVSSNSRTAGRWLRARTSPDLSGRRAAVIGTSGCRCNSGRVFTSGCSSIAERIVGDDEAAGAIPATQTNGRRPTAGHRAQRLHFLPGSGRRRCLPLPR